MDNTHLPPDGGLFQSELWKDFQKQLGKEIFETDFCWGVISKAPLLESYGEISRGPLQESLDPQVLRQELKKVAKKYHLSLIRLEPQHHSFMQDMLQSGLRVRKAPFDAQPRETLMLSLEKSEEELLASMKSKTRYNIRLAEKKGVIVRPIESDEEKEKFLNLFSETAKRKHISFHNRSYYEALINYFSGEKGKTYIALLNGKVLAGSILAFFGETAYYLHGASSDEGRNMMAPHLLQWTQIRLSKAKKLQKYDFGGVAMQETRNKENWAGITRFKQGFAPGVKSVIFPGTYDVLFSPTKYFLYIWLASIKKILV